MIKYGSRYIAALWAAGVIMISTLVHCGEHWRSTLHIKSNINFVCRTIDHKLGI